MEMNATPLLLIKVTLLLLIAFAAVRWQRTAPATQRHGVWSVTFVALLALPLLAFVLPDIRVPVPAWPANTEALQSATASPELSVSSAERNDAIPLVPTPTALSSATNNKSDRGPAPIRVTTILLLVWFLGVLGALGALARSLLRVRALAASANPVRDAGWLRSAERIARELGLDTIPRLASSASVSAPMAGHVGQAIVFLPADAAQWDVDRRDVVLTHELTHLVRRDPWRILAARVACALYWFHPLMWLAARRSASDCEQACDEHVLALGIRPSTYARVLLDFANHAPAPMLSAALSIVQRHRLETRVMAILSSARSPRRVPSAWRTVLTTLTAVAVVAGVAAMRPAPAEAVSSVSAVLPADVSTAASVQPNAVWQPTANEAPLAAVIRPPVRTAEVVVAQGRRCWDEYGRSRNFTGSTTNFGDRITQRIGRIDGERVAQMTYDDIRVCMITDGYAGPQDARPSEWMGRANRIVIETERDNDVRRLEVDGGRSTWTINGRSVAMDEGTSSWRRAVLDLLDASWEVSSLRGEASSLRGEISSILGERSSLLGEISSLRGEVSSMLGEISSIRGEESSLRGEISSIRGHESSLRGQISSERGAISSLESQRWERGSDRETIATRIRRHEENIRDIQAEITRYDADARVRAVEREIAAFDADRRVAEVQRRIRDFDVEHKVAQVEKEIAELGVEREVASIENEIRSLDVETRVRRMELRREQALDQLRSLLRR